MAFSGEEVAFDYDPGYVKPKPAVEPYDIIPVSNEKGVDPSGSRPENVVINLHVASQEDTSRKRGDDEYGALAVIASQEDNSRNGGDDENGALTIIPEERMEEIMTGIKRIENQTIDYVSHLIKENEALRREIELLKGKIDEQNLIINKLLEEKNNKH